MIVTKLKIASRKETRYWLALAIGTIATVIVANIVTFSYQFLTDKNWWHSLMPPSGATKIITAHNSDIWVETNSGKIYTVSVDYCGNDESCHRWRELSDISVIPGEYQTPSRGDNCVDLQKGLFPLNPLGRIIECVYSNSNRLTTGDENYFALMADGSVKYRGDMYWDRIVRVSYFNLSTIILPLLAAIMISFFYLGRYVIKRIRKNDQNIAG